MPQSARDEGGFLLLGMVAMILLLGAAYTSFAFTLKKQWNWDLNYAMGQQFAQISNAAHLYVQAVAYDPDYLGDPQRVVFNTGAGPGNQIQIGAVGVPNTLIGEGFLPAGFTLNRNKYQNITITAYGDRAPRGGAPNAAPTAFALIDIDVAPNRRRTGADIAAFRAGAASKGLARLGIPVLTTSNRACNAGTSFVRWGENPNDCLTLADINAITGGGAGALDQNDAIAPAWEVVNEATDFDALYRYPQPGRPDAQIINTEIRMDGGGANAIRGASYMDTDIIAVANQMLVNDPADPLNLNNTIGSMTVNGDPLDPATNATIGGNVDVLDSLLDTNTVLAGSAQVGNGLIIQGNLDIVLGGLNEAVGNDVTLDLVGNGGTEILGIIGNPLNDPANTDGLYDQGTGMAINVLDGNDLVVTDRIIQTGGIFTIEANGVNAGDFQAPTLAIDIGANNVNLATSSDTGEITVDNVVLGTDVEFGSLTMGVGSSVDIGGSLDVNVDCFGPACPDAIQDPPDDTNVFD